MSRYQFPGAIAFSVMLLCCLSCNAIFSEESGDNTAIAQVDTTAEEVDLDLNAENLLRSYYEALSNRDSKALQKLLFYSNKFYLEEPQPIVKWELLRVEELNSEEADAFDIKPNPIKDDLILYVKISTIDEYKKRTWKQRYFVREQKGRWGFVNRIGADTCAGIFLKYGEDAIDFEEYPVLAQRKGQYLVQIRPHQIIVVDEKTRVLGKVLANRDCSLQFLAPDSLYCAGQLMALWRPGGALEAVSQDDLNEFPDSLKTE